MKRTLTNCLALAALAFATGSSAVAANSYRLTRGAAPASYAYTLEVFGDPVHSIHVTGTNMFGWQVFAVPGWSPSVGTRNGIAWTAEETGNFAPRGEFKFYSTDFSIDYLPVLQVSVDLQSDPSKLIRIPPVPEPETMSLAIIGIGLLMGVRRFGNRRQGS